MDGVDARHADAGAHGASGDRSGSVRARRPLVARVEARLSRTALAQELAAPLDQECDDGVRALVDALVALRDAPLTNRTALRLARRDPEFAAALARACDLADELGGP